MLNKTAIILLLAEILWTTKAHSQQNTRSPYSLFGVGILHSESFADISALGRNNTSYRFQSNYSLKNPASLSALNVSVFNVSPFFELGNYKTGTQTNDFSNAGFNYISLAAPIKKYKSGIAFSLLPFSDIGYNIYNTKDSGGVSIRNEYQGRGGLSRFNIGAGTQIFKYLSAGISYSYIFGQVDETQKRRYPGNRVLTSVSDNNNLYLRGSRLDLGLQFHILSDSGLNHILGLNFTSNAKLKGEQNRLIYTFTELYSGSETIWDTILFDKEKSANITLPQNINVSYTIGKSEKWQANAAISKNMWSNFNSITDHKNSFINENQISFGFFICPKPIFDKSIKNDKVKNYLKSIRYSAGYYQSSGFVKINDKNIVENSISFGIGLPFTQIHKHVDGTRIISTSRIFLTAEYISRGTTQNNLIKENFFRLTLGLNLADKWFNKRLYN
ncbi:MAG: hypothetical protein HUU47_05110 [Bacteroidetes bacterium]|nr:hypothetical protein [Bacteroidota bacterium]